MQAERATYTIWALWAVSWLLAALWSTRARGRPGFGAEAPYRLVQGVGIILLMTYTSSQGSPVWGDRSLRPLGGWVQPIWASGVLLNWLMVSLTLVGFAFCWWARVHLGRLWSGNVTVKADHRVVDTGPYALVRHPIYTGLLTAALAMMAEKGTTAAVAGFVILTVGIWLKARLEEEFLRAQLGPEAYDAYSRRVPMLVPFATIKRTP